MNNICIDLTNIVPGKGGTGGGIATYGKELILGIDELLGGNEDFNTTNKVTVLLNTETYKNLKLKYMDVRCFAVNNQNILTRMYWLQVRLPAFLKKEKMDLLHRVLSEMPLRKVCKYVVTVHDFMFEYYLLRSRYRRYLSGRERVKFRVLNRLLAQSVRTSDLVVTNSESTSKDVLARFEGVGPKVSSIRLGYSQSSSASNRTASYSADNRIVFGVVAAFHPHKGHRRVLKLARRMVALGYGDSFRFCFRGSPVYQEYYDEIKEEIAAGGLEPYFTFEKYDPNVSLADIYNRYSATVLLSEYEGFGLPVIESQAFGRPVVCSGIPVFKEILGDTAMYLTTDPSDSEIIKLMQDLRNPAYLDRLIESGKKNSAKYTWSKTCESTWKAYLGLLT